nr:sugar ABC transporter permease [Oscillospiraceae bacterium]
MRLKKHGKLDFSLGYILPAMSVLILMLVIPLGYTVYCSMYNLDYLVKGDFVGLGNYLKLLKDPRITKSLVFTFQVTIISTMLSVVIGLIMALWVDRTKGKLAYLIEMFGLIPWVISMMVAALLWRWLFNGELGLFNMIIKALGGDPIYVVENKNSAIIALIFVLTWRLVGYAMIMILAGLKSLDTTLIEAAKVDGASPWQMLWHIKLPLIKTQMLLSTIVLTVSNFTNNTVPKVLTSGGPNDATNVITLFQYNLGFRYYQFGTSAALSIIIMALTSLIIVLYIKVSDYKI